MPVQAPPPPASPPPASPPIISLTGFAPSIERRRPDAPTSGRPYVAAGLAIAAVAVLLSLPFVSALQADSFKALYDGRFIATHGVPHREALTVMAQGRSWIDQQWLAETILYRAWQLGGDAAVAILSLVAIATAYVVLAVAMVRRGVSLLFAVGAALLAVLTLSGWQFPRSQDLVLPLFAVLLALCAADARRARPGRSMLAVPPLLVLWANLHGSVLLGVTVTCAYALVRTTSLVRDRAFGPAAACAALGAVALVAPLATPYGTGIVHYYSEFFANPAMARMAIEWAPVQVPSLPFVELCIPAALAIGVAVRALRRRAWPPVMPTVAVVLTGVAAVRESGSIVWFGMASALLVAEVMAPDTPTPSVTRRAAVAVGVAGLLGICLAIAQAAGRPASGYESSAPSSVIAAVSTDAALQPCALILADNATASALLWHVPALAGRIGFDARLEQYRPADLARFAAFEDGRTRNWVATTRGFSILVAGSGYAPALARRLPELGSGWSVSRIGDTVIAVARPRAGARLACRRRPT